MLAPGASGSRLRGPTTRWTSRGWVLLGPRAPLVTRCSVVVEGPHMADLVSALLLVGGFALLALTLRGLDSL